MIDTLYAWFNAGYANVALYFALLFGAFVPATILAIRGHVYAAFAPAGVIGFLSYTMFQGMLNATPDLATGTTGAFMATIPMLAALACATTPFMGILGKKPKNEKEAPDENSS